MSAVHRVQRRVVCQVHGCPNLLPTATLYHRRYKICLEHASLESMKLDGTVVRFCQQCGRFQPLSEFDADKRSCRRKLQMHNIQRKRARDAVKSALVWSTSPAGSPRGSTGTTFQLRKRPATCAAAVHAPAPELPGTPSSRLASQSACLTAPSATVSGTQDIHLQSATTLGHTFSIPEINDFDIEEILKSLEDGIGMEQGPSGVTDVLLLPPAARPHSPKSSGSTDFNAVPQKRPRIAESPFIAVPPVDPYYAQLQKHYDAQQASLASYPYLLGGMSFAAPPQSLVPLMPPAWMQAQVQPAASTLAQPSFQQMTTGQAAELVVVVPAENSVYIFPTPAP